MQNQIRGFRLSPQQKRLWSLLQDSPLPPAQCVIRIEGQLNESTLKESLQDVIDRHQILRTTFNRSPGIVVPIQVVLDSSTPSWRAVRLPPSSPDDGVR